MVSIESEQPSNVVASAAATMVEAIDPWYENLRNKKGTVDSNVMCAGLYITEFLAVTFPLTHGDFAADSQVKGASGTKAKAILADHGELRQFTREGGRTSRYTIKHAENLAEVVNAAGTEAGVRDFTPQDLRALASFLQAWFIARVQKDYFGKQKVSAEIDPGFPVRTTVASLLEAGRARGGNAAGAIAQHLVGAKLQIRFPNETINIESYTTADVQTGRAGDYQVGDTAIHVTMAPGMSLFENRCAHNLRHGFRPRVLVPDSAVAAASQIARLADLHQRVAVQSIEDFVGTNIEEVAGFAQTEVRAQLRKLLELYNERIDVAEADKSLKIEIPANL
ncbi:DUF4928 family protein [Streptomyces sp. NPDC088910]|uniref:DUF4928 family protein n=1 Tax=Streptomyces sp. NPDC088910 TaxID=3365911 RepID=UPI0038199E2D